jgi:hypothetical protein
MGADTGGDEKHLSLPRIKEKLKDAISIGKDKVKLSMYEP